MRIWSTDECINKRWYVHTMEDYLAMKNERSSDICYSMNKSWNLTKEVIHKRTYYIILFIWNIQNSKSIEISSCLGLREIKGWGLTAK